MHQLTFTETSLVTGGATAETQIDTYTPANVVGYSGVASGITMFATTLYAEAPFTQEMLIKGLKQGGIYGVGTALVTIALLAAKSFLTPLPTASQQPQS